MTWLGDALEPPPFAAGWLLPSMSVSVPTTTCAILTVVTQQPLPLRPHVRTSAVHVPSRGRGNTPPPPPSQCARAWARARALSHVLAPGGLAHPSTRRQTGATNSGPLVVDVVHTPLAPTITLNPESPPTPTPTHPCHAAPQSCHTAWQALRPACCRRSQCTASGHRPPPALPPVPCCRSRCAPPCAAPPQLPTGSSRHQPGSVGTHQRGRGGGRRGGTMRRGERSAFRGKGVGEERSEHTCGCWSYVR